MVKNRKNIEVEVDREDPWRVFRIMAEFVEGFSVLSKVGPAVTIFGSARIKSTHPMYKKAEQIAYLLAKEGYAIITGGGPGIMEAANRGASAGDDGIAEFLRQVGDIRPRHIVQRVRPPLHGGDGLV